MRVLLAAFCLLMAAVSTVSTGQPLSDTAVDQAWENFEAVWHDLRAGTAKGADLVAAYDEYIEPLPFERMSSRQLAMFDRMAFQFGTGMERSLTRLESILDEKPDDLHAMIRLVDLLVWARSLGYQKEIDASSERIAPMLDRILTHPELSVSVVDGTAALLPITFQKYGDDEAGYASQRSGYEILFDLLDRSTLSNQRVAVEIGSRWQAVKAIGFDDSRLRIHRDVLLPQIQSALALAEADPDPDLVTVNTIQRAKQALGKLTSTASLRDFVGSQAPELTIQWSSDSSIKTLADLRGKVVLLNFWVTGCGHCINAIPRMREIADRYHGTDVVILGVTSLQGRHFKPSDSDGAPITTSGDPIREYALMLQLMDSERISWPVVFTAESAWNSAYEVQGTPHLTLVDPSGVVVNNNMRPGNGFEQITENIDETLNAFGLDVPKSTPGRNSRSP